MKQLVIALALITFSSGTAVAADAVIAEAVANSARPAEDRARDENRKPAEVLEYFGIVPGMHVLDIFAGGGYYSEILSYIVGPEGRVTLFNNGGWDGFAGAGVQERLAGDRLPNVVSAVAEPAEMDFAPNSFDAALFVLGFHDLYYVDQGWPAIDAGPFMEKIFASIKPGGILGIVDHAAEPGVSVAVANTLHRIDPGIIRVDMSKAGFEYVGESDVLRNPNDNRNIPMSDPSVRGMTDRVVMKFRKPVLPR